MKCTLNPSDVIEIIGIISSLITSFVAIVISLKTLKQNSKMIEYSSRPYIGIYTVSKYVEKSSYYLVVKNFGQSSATISSFTYDYDISQLTTHGIKDHEPFQYIEGSTVMPGQAFYSLIDFKSAYSVKEINFHVVYSSGTHQYSEDIRVNLISNYGNFVSHNTSPGNELLTISETLQEIYLHSL